MLNKKKETQANIYWIYSSKIRILFDLMKMVL